MNGEVQRKMEALYETLGERCPSQLAIHLGIEVDGISDLEECISGVYLKPSPDTTAIVLNSTMSLEQQEKALCLLLAHHLSHEGVWYALKRETLDKEMRRFHSKVFFEIKSLLRNLEGSLQQ